MRPLLLSTFDSVRQTLIHYKAIHHKDTKPQKLFQIFVTLCLRGYLYHD